MPYNFTNSSAVSGAPAGVISSPVLTYMAWILATGSATNQGQFIFATESIQGTSMINLNFRSSVNHLRYFHRTTLSNGEWRTADSTIPTGVWTHVAVTQAAGVNTVPTFYINGESVATTTITTATGVSRSTQAVRYMVGAPSSLATGFLGAIGHLEIFPRVLAPGEVRHSMFMPHSRQAGESLSLPMYGVGDTVAGDISTTKRHGTWYGTLTASDSWAPISGVGMIPVPCAG